MVEPTLKVESTDGQEGEKAEQVTSIENEIECPRCHDSMNLCSDFDRLFYSCDGCDFCLYTIKH
jgi:hypothetical protein